MKTFTEESPSSSAATGSNWERSKEVNLVGEEAPSGGRRDTRSGYTDAALQYIRRVFLKRVSVVQG